LVESEVRDEAELAKLKESYGTTGSKLATGGNKAVKELEKVHKMKQTRKLKDILFSFLLETATVKIGHFPEDFQNYLATNNSEFYATLTVDNLEFQTQLTLVTIKYTHLLSTHAGVNLILEAFLCEIGIILHQHEKIFLSR
jgi:DNA polymerase-3 subunit delta'